MTSRSGRHLTIIQGHPDRAGGHLCHALAEAYADGAKAANHQVRILTVADLDLRFMRTQEEFDSGVVNATIKEAQRDVEWAEHLLIVFPLWLGTMPAILKAFFEQVMRPHFAFSFDANGRARKQLSHRSARIIVTMGMPSFVYRWYFCAHGVRCLKRNILQFVGIDPVRVSYLGTVQNISPMTMAKWTSALRRDGENLL